MKFVFKSFLIVIFLFVLSACGGGGSTGNSSGNMGGSSNINSSALPTKARIVALSTPNEKTAVVEWIPSVDDNTKQDNLKYKIYYSKQKFIIPKNAKLYDTLINKNNAKLDNLDTNTTYYIKIVTIDNNGNEAWSDLKSITTPAIKTELNNISIKNLDNSQIKINGNNIETNSSLKKNQVVYDLNKGVLRKITSVKKENNKSIATSKNVTIEDIYKQYNYNTKIILDDIDNNQKTNSRFSARILPNGNKKMVWKSGLTIIDKKTDAIRLNKKIGNSKKLLNTRYVSPVTNSKDFAYGSVNLSKKVIVEAGKEIKIPVNFKYDLKTFKVQEYNQNKNCSILDETIDTTNEILNGNFAIKTCSYVTTNKYKINKKSINLIYADGSNKTTKVELIEENGKFYLNWTPTNKDVSDKPHKVKLNFELQPIYKGKEIEGYKDNVSIETEIYVSKGKVEPKKEETQLVKFTKGMNVDNTFNMSFTPTISISDKFTEIKNKGISKKISISSKLDINQKLDINAYANATIDETKNFWDKEFVKVIWIGQVPVLLKGEFKLDMRFEGEASADVNIQENFMNTFNIEVDVNINHKSDGSWVITPSKRFNKTYTLNINGNATGKLNAKVTIIPDLKLKVYEVLATRIRLLPYLYEDSTINGNFNYTNTDNISSFSYDYGFENIEAGVGMDMTIFIGRGWGRTWVDDWVQLTYPNNAEVDDTSTHKKITLIKPIKLIQTPKLTAKYNYDKKTTLNSRAIWIEGVYKDQTDTNLGKFEVWDGAKISNDDSLEASIIKDTSNKNGFWLIPKNKGIYDISLIGHSNLGKWARQYTKLKISLEDNDNDGILDYWEDRYPQPKDIDFECYKKAFENGEVPKQCNNINEQDKSLPVAKILNNDNIDVIVGDSIYLKAKKEKNAKYKWYQNGYLKFATGDTAKYTVTKEGVYTIELRVSNDGFKTYSKDKITINVHPKAIKNETILYSILPTETYVNKNTTFIIKGKNIPNNIRLNLEDGENCSIKSHSSKNIEFMCKPKEYGNKKLTIYYGKNKKDYFILIKQKPMYKFISLISSSSPNDKCKSFWSSGCEASVEAGKSYVKDWLFKNVGNVDLSNLRVVSLDSDKEIKATIINNIDSTLKTGDTTDVSIQLNIPRNITPGVHKGRFKIVDNKGDIRYQTTNNTVFFWYIFNITYSVPNISLAKVNDTLEGESVDFVATLNSALDSKYNLKISLGDGGGGYLSPKNMKPNSIRRKFTYSTIIKKPGNRKYRVAVYYGEKRISDWVNGDYKIITKSKIPQNLTATQQNDGVLLSWDEVKGAKNYTPMTSINYTKDSEYMDITSGCDFQSKTSCLINKSRFKKQTIWYFAVKADNGPMSEKVKFEWKDSNILDPDNKYIKYLAGKTLYSESGENYEFAEDLSYIKHNNDITEIELTKNGLQILNKENLYYVLKTIKSDFIVIEKAEITEEGVYLSHDGEKKLYFKKLDNNVDLKKLIVGKTYYNACKNDNNGKAVSIVFGSNGIITVNGDREQDKIPYRIEDNNIITTEDGKEKTHTFVDKTDKYISFQNKNGEVDRFYYNKLDAEANPSDCENEHSSQPIKISNLISGRVHFLDEDNNTISIPSDAWIRITPKKYQENGNWNGLNCKIYSNGSFGSECYIDSDEDGIRRAFNDSSTKYQIVVYKNHIKPNEPHWNCGEDVYKYVGDDLASSYWQNIKVTPDDYQDRSKEKCTDNKDNEYSIPIVKASNRKYSNKVIITWNTIENVDSYIIYRCQNTNINSCSKLDEVSDNIYEDRSIVGNTVYYYRIKVRYNNSNISDYSNYSRGSLSANAIIPLVENIESSSSYSDKIIINWSNTVGSDILYRVYRCQDTNINSCKLVSTRTNTTYTDKAIYGLKNGVNYYYRVRILAGTKEGKFSNYTIGKLADVANTMNPPVASQGKYGDKILITWTYLEGAKKYKIMACDTYTISAYDIENSKHCRSLGVQNARTGNGNIYTQTNDLYAKKGKKYWYYIKAENDAGWGEYSEISNSGYVGLEYPLSPNIWVSPETDEQGGIEIGISKPGDQGASKYYIFKCSSIDITSCIYIQTILPYTKAYDPHLAKGKYYYRAKSISYNGNESNFGNYKEINVTKTKVSIPIKYVKKTGQTKSYDQNGNEVNNGSIKDDGYYQTGIIPSYSRDNNQIVKDNITGLFWQDNNIIKNNTMDWENANRYCQSLSLGGYSGWRLPTINELISIMDREKLDPIVSNKFHNIQPSSYWSSTLDDYLNNDNNKYLIGYYRIGYINSANQTLNIKTICVKGK